MSDDVVRQRLRAAVIAAADAKHGNGVRLAKAVGEQPNWISQVNDPATQILRKSLVSRQK